MQPSYLLALVHALLRSAPGKKVRWPMGRPKLFSGICTSPYPVCRSVGPIMTGNRGRQLKADLGIRTKPPKKNLLHFAVQLLPERMGPTPACHSDIVVYSFEDKQS